MSSEDSKEIAALDVHVHVIISSSSGVSWIMYLAEICIHPVEAWWAGVSDANLPIKLDGATDGVRAYSRLMPTPGLAPKMNSVGAHHTPQQEFPSMPRTQAYGLRQYRTYCATGDVTAYSRLMLAPDLALKMNSVGAHHTPQQMLSCSAIINMVTHSSCPPSQVLAMQLMYAKR